MKKLTNTLTLAIFLTLSMAACSTITPVGVSPKADQLDPFAELAIGKTGSSVSWAVWPSDLAGTFPNSTYVLRGERGKVITRATFSDVVVTGTFISSAVHSSTLWNEDDSRTEVGPLDHADTRVVHLDFTTDEVIAIDQDTSISKNVTVAVVVDGSQDAQALGQKLVDSGNVVLVLEKPDNAYFGGAWTVSLMGTLIGKLADDGQISFPILTALRARGENLFEEVDDKTTLESLKTVAELPDSEIIR